MANIEDVGKNAAQKVGNSAAQQASSAASNAAQNIANSSSKSVNQVPKYSATSSVSPSNSSNNKPNLSNNNSKNYVSNVGASNGSSSVDTEDMTPDEEKEFKKQRDIENNAEALDAVADVAASSGNAYAQLFGRAHKVLSKNQAYRNFTAKVTRSANKLAPGAQSMINKAVESGAAEKAAAAVAAKNGEADKAAENATKNGLDDSTKKAVKQAARRAGDKGKSEHSYETEGMIILKNPITWIIVAFFIIIILLVSCFVLFFDNSSKKGGTCEFPYVEMDYYDKITVKDGDQFFDVDLEDYVPGVIAHEVRDFEDSPEMLKVQAIAARTYAQYMMRYQGYVINSAVNQTYDPDDKYTTPGNPIYEASQATAGLVLIRYDENNTPRFIMSEYDALAIDESCGGKEDVANNYVIICQGKIKVPIDWLKAGMIESDYNFFKRNFHGRGMSQWGGYYLTKEKGYDYKQVLNLFYGDAQIVSLYPCLSGLLDIQVTPGDIQELDYYTAQDFFKDNGTSIKAVNDGLLDVILSSGPGTREAVVNGAIYTINAFVSLGKKIPYQWAGGQGYWFSSHDYVVGTYYGINPWWGEESHSSQFGHDYDSLGLDCGSWVTWTLRNGGLSYPGNGYIGYKSITNVERYDPQNPDKYQGQPGDILSGNDHVALILQYFEDEGGKGYYIAEANGFEKGINIHKKYLYEIDDDYDVIDMSYHYENSRTPDFEQAFQDGRKD